MQQQHDQRSATERGHAASQGARGNLSLDPLGSPDYDVVVRRFDS